MRLCRAFVSRMRVSITLRSGMAMVGWNADALSGLVAMFHPAPARGARWQSEPTKSTVHGQRIGILSSLITSIYIECHWGGIARAHQGSTAVCTMTSYQFSRLNVWHVHKNLPDINLPTRVKLRKETWSYARLWNEIWRAACEKENGKLDFVNEKSSCSERDITSDGWVRSQQPWRSFKYAYMYASHNVSQLGILSGI